MTVWPSGAQATAMLSTIKVFHVLDSPDGAHFVAVMMVVFSLVAVHGAIAVLGRGRAFYFTVQQVILGFQAGGGIYAMVLGGYLDGTQMWTVGHPGWPHIYNDQVGWIGLFLIHLLAAAFRCWDRG